MSSPEAALQTMIRNLEDKTGKTLAEWIKIAQTSQLSKSREILNFLKTNHGLTYGYANLVALKTLEVVSGPASGDDLVAAQYAGVKAPMRPVYDALVAGISKFGNDVEIAPKKAYVSLRRKKQFAILQPSTGSRLDVGINLKGTAATGRLEPSGSFNAMVSHRVRISGKNEVDKELLGWLRKAYENA